MATKRKLTKAVVDDLLKAHQDALNNNPDSTPAQRDVFDSDLQGFLVRLGKTKAVYSVLIRRNGKLTRTVIGEHGVYYPDHNTAEFNARKHARLIITEIEKGLNPNKVKKDRREQGVTLAEAYQAYLDENKLKPLTIREYSSLLRNHAQDWMNKPLKELTASMVQQRHRETTKKAGDAQANKLVRTLRTICNQNKGLLPDNPACMPRNKWNKNVKRTRLIMSHQLPAWYMALINHKNQDWVDYLMLHLLTGMRRKEGLSILWGDVDFQSRAFTIRDTKNGTDHTMPMSDFTFDLFKRRESNKLNEHVFPSLTSASGHLEEPKKAVSAIAKASGVPFTMHDLRRTFSSAANKLGIAKIDIKRMINHSTGDVTEGYIFDIEESAPHQRSQELTDLVLGYITRPAAVLIAVNLLLEQDSKQAAKVISLDEHRRAAA